MKKIIRLTENDLVRLVKRVIKESEDEGNELSPKLQFFWREAGLDWYVKENAHDEDMIEDAIRVISRGERRYKELTDDERDEIIREIRRRVKEHDNRKSKYDKYFAEKDANISKGKEFVSKKTDSGISLHWDRYDNQYVIYFPENELDTQMLPFGDSDTDLRLGEEIFELIKTLEEAGMSSEKLYRYAKIAKNK